MHILTVCSDTNYSNFLNKKLASMFGESATTCATLDAALAALKQMDRKLIICCFPLDPKICPCEVLASIKSLSPKSEVIIIAQDLQLHKAMELIRSGAYNCYNRPFPIEQLLAVLRPLKERQALNSIGPFNARTIKKDKPGFGSKNYVRGLSEVAKVMYDQIDLVGPTSFSVIIYGETGTGKEAVAHRVAKAGDVSGEAPYIPVDCGCLSKELALSELFGHEKGSFTGALSQKKGAFELANNGTLFLDEIGNLDYEVQGYLLRAIQERKIRRLGGSQEIIINTRIIVASNEHLAEAVQKGKFREDLYHRLNEFEIIVPPLRSRPEDLPLFMDHFITGTNIELGKTVKAPDPAALDLIQRYHWPGNIRELRNVVRRACLLTADGCAISAEELPEEITKYAAAATLSYVQALPLKARDITISKINEALKTVNYNKSKAAKLLGIDRKTLYNKLNTLHFINDIESVKSSTGFPRPVCYNN
ncbi:MAG: sigma-54-dependent Fis family transcriptional regulator [Taibaiella sp.]|nr:sigma-54-dependent Fis family transcriptional regulator [Taibaiella sp.]